MSKNNNNTSEEEAMLDDLMGQSTVSAEADSMMDIEDDDDLDMELEADSITDKGDYPAVLVDAQKGTSSTGNEQLMFRFKLITANKTEAMWISLLPAVRWKLTSVMKGLGVKVVNGKFNLKKSELIGTPCIITIDHRKYQGSDRIDITKVVPMSPAQLEKYTIEIAAARGN